MKTRNLLLIGTFGAVAFSSWVSPIYGKFDWSWTYGVPSLLAEGEAAVDRGVLALLGSVDEFYGSAEIAENRQSYCPDTGDTIPASPAVLTTIQVAELIEAKAQGISLNRAKLMLGEPLCLVANRKVAWLVEDSRFLEVDFSEDWFVIGGQISDRSN